MAPTVKLSLKAALKILDFTQLTTDNLVSGIIFGMTDDENILANTCWPLASKSRTVESSEKVCREIERLVFKIHNLNDLITADPQCVGFYKVVNSDPVSFELFLKNVDLLLIMYETSLTFAANPVLVLHNVKKNTVSEFRFGCYQFNDEYKKLKQKFDSGKLTMSAFNSLVQQTNCFTKLNCKIIEDANTLAIQEICKPSFETLVEHDYETQNNILNARVNALSKYIATMELLADPDRH